jgi:type III pantothenate kinase
MKYNLCIDIGNTNIKSGIFVNNVLKELIIGLDALLEFKINSEFQCIYSSVRKTVPFELNSVFEKCSKTEKLSHNTILPIKLDYQTPETLGTDRIATAVAAHTLFPQDNCIVIDAGTCVTSDFIDTGGIFHGGNISPGIRMRIKAMNAFTSALPLVEIEYNENILGKSTIEALQNGAVKGTIWEINTFINEIEKIYGKSKLVFTGGDTKYFVNYFKSTIFADSNLVLYGLNEILNFNNEE